jgi:hypothetical protein
MVLAPTVPPPPYGSAHRVARDPQRRGAEYPPTPSKSSSATGGADPMIANSGAPVSPVRALARLDNHDVTASRRRASVLARRDRAVARPAIETPANRASTSAGSAARRGERFRLGQRKRTRVDPRSACSEVVLWGRVAAADERTCSWRDAGRELSVSRDPQSCSRW